MPPSKQSRFVSSCICISDQYVQPIFSIACIRKWKEFSLWFFSTSIAFICHFRSDMTIQVLKEATTRTKTKVSCSVFTVVSSWKFSIYSTAKLGPTTVGHRIKLSTLHANKDRLKSLLCCFLILLRSIFYLMQIPCMIVGEYFLLTHRTPRLPLQWWHNMKMIYHTPSMITLSCRKIKCIQ